MVYPLPHYRMSLRYAPYASASCETSNRRPAWTETDERILKRDRTAESDSDRRLASKNQALKRGLSAGPAFHSGFPRFIVEESALKERKRLTEAGGERKSEVGRKSAAAAFLSVVSAGLNRLNKKPEDLTGRLFLENSIPLGAGLASSAAFAAGAAWLLQKAGFHLKPDLASFAVSLEQAFHGQSSGMDVHAVLCGKPLLFKKGGPRRRRALLNKRLRPLLLLTFSGGGGSGGLAGGKGRSAKQAVSKVNRFFRENPEKAKALDGRMAEAVCLAKEILSLKTKEAVFVHLKRSLDLAESCFREWGLVPPPLDDHIQKLKKAGAAAAKPCGAGLGGAVISLWRNPPPPALKTADAIPLSL